MKRNAAGVDVDNERLGKSWGGGLSWSPEKVSISERNAPRRMMKG